MLLLVCLRLIGLLQRDGFILKNHQTQGGHDFVHPMGYAEFFGP